MHQLYVGILQRSDQTGNSRENSHVRLLPFQETLSLGAHAPAGCNELSDKDPLSLPFLLELAVFKCYFPQTSWNPRPESSVALHPLEAPCHEAHQPPICCPVDDIDRRRMRRSSTASNRSAESVWRRRTVRQRPRGGRRAGGCAGTDGHDSPTEPGAHCHGASDADHCGDSRHEGHSVNRRPNPARNWRARHFSLAAARPPAGRNRGQDSVGETIASSGRSSTARHSGAGAGGIPVIGFQSRLAAVSRTGRDGQVRDCATSREMVRH